MNSVLGEKVFSDDSDITEVSISNTWDDHAQVDEQEYEVTRVVEFIEGFHGSTVTLYVDTNGYFTGDFAQSCHPCTLSGRFHDNSEISGVWAYTSGNGSGGFHLSVNGPVSFTGNWTLGSHNHEDSWLWVKPRLTWYLRTFDVVTALLALLATLFVLTVQFFQSVKVFHYLNASINFYFASIYIVVIAQYLHWFYPGHPTTFGILFYIIGYMSFFIPNVFSSLTVPCLWIGTFGFTTGSALLSYAFYPTKNSPKSLRYAFYGAIEFLFGSLILAMYCIITTFTSWYSVSNDDILFTLNVLCLSVFLVGRIHFLACAVRGYYVLDKSCVPLIASFGWRQLNYDSTMLPISAPSGYSLSEE